MSQALMVIAWKRWLRLERTCSTPGPRYCSRCGTANDPANRFCSECGMLLH